MVQKDVSSQPKRRGRPRAYDPDKALAQATEAFWKKGYSGTSLDDLSAATGMNRPSLYAAFGDKRDLYLKALNQYWTQGGQLMRDAFQGDGPLRDALMAAYTYALSLYFPRGARGRGCFAISTATTEALEEPKIRELLAQGLDWLDHNFEKRIRVGQARGEIAPDADPRALALIASATMYTMALRARAGMPRSEVEALARSAVNVICGRRPEATLRRPA
jgi:TetR/AcrR family transcriptional regulator, copper-responsive repressor